MLNLSPKIVVIILNTNRCMDTLACLDSVLQGSYKLLDIIVLDNKSTDGSVKAIRDRFPSVKLFELEENLGYAGNNNLGIDLALKQNADWVLILNEDTILAPDCLQQLVKVAEDDPCSGMVGPMVYHFGEPNVIQSAGGQLDKFWTARHFGHNELDVGQFSKPRPVYWLSGCALMIRRQVIEQAGVFDERFFIYWEEIDWCLRARQLGWRLLHVPQARLWHKGVQRDYQPKPSVTYYSTRNQFLLLFKHSASIFVQIYCWVQAFRTMISWTVKPKWRNMRDHRQAIWLGVCDFLQQQFGMRSHFN